VRRGGGGDRNVGAPLPGPAALGAVAEAEFADVDGTVRREALGRCWSVAFERVLPVRGLRRFGGSGTGQAGGGSLARVSSGHKFWLRERAAAGTSTPSGSWPRTRTGGTSRPSEQTDPPANTILGACAHVVVGFQRSGVLVDEPEFAPLRGVA
jgi:hypothetical protein